MELFALFSQRQSCRHYRDQPVEAEKIRQCLEAGRLAPSACNSQPWTFIVVDKPDLVHEIAASVQDKLVPINRFASQVPVFIVVVEEPANLAAVLGGRIKKQKYAAFDLGLATGQICLAATALGLGSCILGWFSARKIRRLLSIPPGKTVRMLIALGYPADTAVRRKKRKSESEVMRYNDYHQSYYVDETIP